MLHDTLCRQSTAVEGAVRHRQHAQMKGLVIGAALAALFAAPAAAHIPKRSHDLVAERIAAQKAAIEGFEALSELVFAHMPMFMIEQAVADASSVLSAKFLAELGLVECIVAE